MPGGNITDALTAPFNQAPSRLMFALVVVLVLVLVGVLAFGVGGHLLANKGVGAGLWGAVHLGPREGLVRVAGPNHEGMAPLPRHRYPRPQVMGESTGAGVWDTAAGQKAIGGDHMTIMGYEDKWVHGINAGRPLSTL